VPKVKLGGPLIEETTQPGLAVAVIVAYELAL